MVTPFTPEAAGLTSLPRCPGLCQGCVLNLYLTANLLALFVGCGGQSLAQSPSRLTSRPQGACSYHT